MDMTEPDLNSVTGTSLVWELSKKLSHVCLNISKHLHT
jgi:hypothetical protein